MAAIVIPELFNPTEIRSLVLPSGRTARVRAATPLFQAWTGPLPDGTYGGKPVLVYRNKQAFAELLILWTFLDSGWEGVWVDTYRSRYLREFWPTPVQVQLPTEQARLLKRLQQTPGSKPWDVFCWSSEGPMFVEAKRSKHDSTRQSQLRFLECGLEIGLPVSSFLLVEWTLEAR